MPAPTNLIGETNDSNIAAVRGTHKGDGSSGVFGEAKTGPGVSGSSSSSVGMDAKSQSGPAALRAVHAGNGPGVLGVSRGNGEGVHGVCEGSGFPGVFGESATGPGVSGASTSSVGMDAKSQSGPAALRAVHAGNGPGVLGVSRGNAEGIHGICEGSGFSGVFGESATGPGVSGSSTSSVGVDAKSESGPAALRAVHSGGGFAGVFGGHVHVTQDLRVDGDVQLTGADLAEQFGVVGHLKADPGSVVVLAGNDQVRVSDESYDHRVAGIVSGAGNYRPGIVLDRQIDADRCALALSGKVWCKVDADCGPVALGDLLTTSPTPGYAMRASDPVRAFGAVIGKALGSLESGRGLVPVLVALQ